MTGRTLSHFRLEEVIGEGGMGIVHRAVDVELQRTVALKVLQPEFIGDEERQFARTFLGSLARLHPVSRGRSDTVWTE